LNKKRGIVEKRRMNIIGRIINLICLLVSILLLFLQGWKLNEFCWIVWVTGLMFSYLCSITGFFHLLFDIKNQSETLTQFVPFFIYSKKVLFILLILTAGLVASSIAILIYTYLFGFYGLFLSVFARMEPLNLFGENGYINSDFFTPLKFLLEKFYMVVIVSLISNFFFILRIDPWSKIFLPFKSKEILRIHIMTLLLPFLSLLFFALFKDKYQTPVIIALLCLFYLINFNFPKRKSREKPSA
jgi:hypothetical protein